MEKPIDLYYWPTPNGWKVTIMLEELGVPYQLKMVNIMKGEQFEESFLKISPNNRMPAIVDHDGPGGEAISIFESGAIMQYLARKYQKFYSNDERQRSLIEQWLFWQVGGLGPMAGQAHHFLHYVPEKNPYAANRYVKECNRLYGVMDKHLKGRRYFADHYSIADMAIFGWAYAHERHNISSRDYSYFSEWFNHIGVREGVKRGVVIGADLRKAAMEESKNANVQKHLFGNDK